MKLNVGCGLNKIDGYINLDINPNNNPDMVRNIEKGLPFDNNKFDEIYCSHILEHIHDLIFVMNECWRVLKVGGILDIDVPDGQYLEWSMRDPTHKRAIFRETFLYFTNSPKVPRYDEIKCEFKTIRLEKVRQINNTGDIKVILQK